MDILIIILLVLIGVVLIILEIFFLPGITVAGFSSLIFFGGGIYYAFVILGLQRDMLQLLRRLLHVLSVLFGLCVQRVWIEYH